MGQLYALIGDRIVVGFDSGQYGGPVWVLMQKYDSVSGYPDSPAYKKRNVPFFVRSFRPPTFPSIYNVISMPSE